MNRQNEEHASDEILPSYIDKQIFYDWILHLKQAKRPMTDITFKYQLKIAERIHNDGHDVNAMIVKAIEHGWTCFYHEKKYDDSSQPGNPNE
jgi:hypothetical protein